jgi:hypothetical protein
VSAQAWMLISSVADRSVSRTRVEDHLRADARGPAQMVRRHEAPIPAARVREGFVGRKDGEKYGMSLSFRA